MAERDPQITAERGHALNEHKQGKRKSWVRPVLMLSLPLALAAGGAVYYLANDHYVSTDNAYVQQDKVSVSAEVNGRIVDVAVHENQPVKAGDLLFRIDPAPYELAAAQADATIASAQVRLTTLQTDYQTSGVDISSAREDVAFFTKEYERQSKLMETGFTTKARLQQAEHALSEARSRLANAEADAMKARAQLATGAAAPGVNPQVLAAQVQKRKALLDLSRTEVRAPESGIVSQADRLQVGQMMVTGLPAVTIVANKGTWIEANFKETDLNNMRIGQPAELTFDAYPKLKLKGHVASIGAGTGSEFSVLPAQNANGNWVKVTQRVPVRIAIDEKSPRPLLAGLSTHVRIDTAR
ncbi:MAG: HlyD family secretion protein [Chakrabartia godavariana]